MTQLPDTEHQPKLLPPTRIMIVLRPHATEKYTAGLDSHLRAATLFIPEMNIGTVESLAVLKRVSQGEMHPMLAVAALGIGDTMRGYLLAVLQILHNSQLEVAIADIAANDPLNQALEAAEHRSVYAAELEQTLQNVRENLINYHRLQSEREDRIVVSLLQQLKQNPQEQSIVMTLGSLHASIVEKLRQQAEQFTQLTVAVDADDTPVSKYEYEVLAQIANGEEISQTTLLHTLLEKLISDSPIRGQLEQVFTDPIEAEYWIKNAVAQFSDVEIKDLYAACIDRYIQKEATGEMIVIGEAFSMLGMVVSEALIKPGGWFEQKGIVVPEPEINDADLYDPYV